MQRVGVEQLSGVKQRRQLIPAALEQRRPQVLAEFVAFGEVEEVRGGLPVLHRGGCVDRGGGVPQRHIAAHVVLPQRRRGHDALVEHPVPARDGPFRAAHDAHQQGPKQRSGFLARQSPDGGFPVGLEGRADVGVPLRVGAQEPQHVPEVPVVVLAPSCLLREGERLVWGGR